MDTFLGPKALMSNDLMQQICYLAHIHALRAPEDLVNQIKWCYSKEHSQTLINLVHLHVPIPEPPHPPMILQNHPTSTLTVVSSIIVSWGTQTTTLPSLSPRE